MAKCDMGRGGSKNPILSLYECLFPFYYFYFTSFVFCFLERKREREREREREGEARGVRLFLKLISFFSFFRGSGGKV